VPWQGVASRARFDLARGAADPTMGQVLTMNRQEAIEILHRALPGVRERYGVQDLAIFGSVARDEASPNSDVDVLVTFHGRTHFRAFMGLQFELEALLGTRVDLVTYKAMRAGLRPHIERDLIHVA